MSTTVKIIAALLLALALSTAILGCNGNEVAPDQLTQEEIEQIVADAATANSAVDTLKSFRCVTQN